MKIKPSLPAGMRDFEATTIAKREYIINTIRTVFLRYGFEPLETPAMELLETLTGKYGQEIDQLLFNVLNNGIHLQKDVAKRQKAIYELLENGKTAPTLTERALRYDLTIPLARYIAANHGQLTFPFKRFQIQSVWRADRPQQGRYREFVQCDADIIGSNSIWNEIELINIYHDVFQHLDLSVTIQLNHRSILSALSEKCDLPSENTFLTTTIDKIEKIGVEKVLDIFIQKGYLKETINIIEKYLFIQGNWEKQLKDICKLLENTTHLQAAIDDITTIMDTVNDNKKLKLNLSLARGLSYYTGCIFEIVPQKHAPYSIGGGGRYDNLTSIFGINEVRGVGISFGLDRIYDTLEANNLFPKHLGSKYHTQVLFFYMGEQESIYAYHKMQELRNKRNVRCELFTQQAKLDKQFKYAERKSIPYIIIIGKKEIASQRYVLRTLATSEQTELTWEELLAYHF